MAILTVRDLSLGYDARTIVEGLNLIFIDAIMLISVLFRQI